MKTKFMDICIQAEWNDGHQAKEKTLKSSFSRE